MDPRGVVTAVAWFLGAVVLTLAGRATASDLLPVGLVVPVGGLGFVWILQATTPARVVAVALGLAVSVGPVLALTGVPAIEAGAVTGALVAQSVVSALLLRRWCPGLLGAGGMVSVHDPVTLARGTGSVVVGSVAGAVVLLATAVVDPPVRPLDVLACWGSLLAGLVLTAAVLHEWWEDHSPAKLVQRRAELVVLALLSWGTAVAVFVQDGLPLAFLVLVFAIWAGSRFATLVTAMLLAVTCGIGITMTALDRGPFGNLDETAAALVTQAFVFTAMVTGFAVATAREERQRLLSEVSEARHEAESRAELLDAMTEAMTDGLVIVDGEARIVRTNAAARQLLELSETGFRPSTRDYSLYRRDGSRMAAEELPSRRALTEGTIDPVDVVLRYSNGTERILNASAHRLSSGFEGSPLAAVVVYRDVTDERERTDQIADFAAVVAHDLRNPLGSAQGWLELAQAQVGEAGAEARMTDHLVRATRALSRMSNLIADLLAQAEAESTALELQDVALDGEDGLIAEIARELDQDRAVTVEPIELVRADAALCHQLLTNLISNAIKYVPPGEPPAITVRGRRRGPRVQVTIQDNGIGVPPELAPKIFDRFYRTPDATSGYAGTGLGLAICRAVVERHGGRITCLPRQDGARGSRFVFDLPGVE